MSRHSPLPWRRRLLRGLARLPCPEHPAVAAPPRNPLNPLSDLARIGGVLAQAASGPKTRHAAMNILIAEDHPEWGQIILNHVQQLGHQATLCTSCQEALTLLNTQTPQIFLTDAMLTDGDMSVEIPRIRQRLPHLGIIVLTAKTRYEEQIRGLTEGADYYLIKPIKLPTLTATLATLSRRLAALERSAPPDQVQWVFDRPTGELTRRPGNEGVRFTDRESIVFSLLLQSPAFPVSHLALFQALGIPEYEFDPHRIDTLIYRVRKKLGQIADSPFNIKNIYSEGFLLAVAPNSNVQFSTEQ
ncbi:hypothetical protein CAL27_11330 [Bordetella genomosp. 1]|uniref:Transcriptional regulator n=1 Tax=Bordetella genomosp. 1 TaxID=1395607 RepID=A0ABX4F0T2_9BORD|nr:hypothetical protein CAL27_11330 [Bordetella genomosp. 1]